MSYRRPLFAEMTLVLLVCIGSTIMYAGQYAWISLLFVAVVLFYLEKYTAK
jgi:hypothetical protein